MFQLQAFPLFDYRANNQAFDRPRKQICLLFFGVGVLEKLSLERAEHLALLAGILDKALHDEFLAEVLQTCPATDVQLAEPGRGVDLSKNTPEHARF